MPRQGARRVWSDSRGALWITCWNSGDLLRYDAKTKTWARWHLPGDGPQPYAVYGSNSRLGHSNHPSVPVVDFTSIQRVWPCSSTDRISWSVPGSVSETHSTTYSGCSYPIALTRSSSAR